MTEPSENINLFLMLVALLAFVILAVKNAKAIARRRDQQKKLDDFDQYYPRDEG